MDAFKVKITKVQPKPGWEMYQPVFDTFGGRYWWPIAEYVGGEVMFRSRFHDHFTQRFMVTR